MAGCHNLESPWLTPPDASASKIYVSSNSSASDSDRPVQRKHLSWNGARHRAQLQPDTLSCINLQAGSLRKLPASDDGLLCEHSVLPKSTHSGRNVLPCEGTCLGDHVEVDTFYNSPKHRKANRFAFILSDIEKTQAVMVLMRLHPG